MSTAPAGISWRSIVRRITDARRLRVRPTGKRLDGYNLLEVNLRLAGRPISVLIREDTTDLDLVRLILCPDSEYRLPPQVYPRVIFDIGANIGITAVYFSVMYPEAEIYCFEPLPQNVELLLANADRNAARVRAFNYGLADRTGTFPYHLSEDPRSFGGGTFEQVGHDPGRVLELQLRRIEDVIREQNIRSVDLFKIDTEGSEWAILQAIPESIRRRAQAFIGELHGRDDWAFCQMLHESHAVGIQKRYDRRCFNFLAVRYDMVQGQNAAAGGTTSTLLSRAA